MTAYPAANPQSSADDPSNTVASGQVGGDLTAKSGRLAEHGVSTIGRISGLLSGLIEDQHLPTGAAAGSRSSAGNAPEHKADRFENDLAMVRLGVATSLFLALRAKHPPTASHCLRAAIACSAWCERLNLADEVRDRIEVAALLHDIGKIGIPDSILKKPGKLSLEEQNTIELCPLLGVEILKGCTADQDLLEIVRLGQAWYDGRREGDSPRRDDLPLGARMLSIVEAFDSMTTDHVYRPAMSRERALAELAKFAGTQFDPNLALDYQRMLEDHPEVVHGGTINRWLNKLRTSQPNQRWRSAMMEMAPNANKQSIVDGFFRQLMVHTHDGVAFIDHNGVVRAWNNALHQLTGVSAELACGMQWAPELIGLRTSDKPSIDADECPITTCLRQGGHRSHRMVVGVTDTSTVEVNLRVSSVHDSQPGVKGVVAMFQDASTQANLEQRVRDLNERVTRDPLTGVGNRAEFDRRLVELTDRARDGISGFSLIICDIDRFKSINDTYGHPAGDEAIIRFSQIISDHSRDCDLVARYGGEEFVLLCPGLDNATAATRAEGIREVLEATPMSFFEGKTITASFGVTEFQEGDTPESVLARADRALLRAKDNGRNRVIQLGVGGFNTLTKNCPRTFRLVQLA
jgi:diguanylate cyclase (GGDEF)-like protein/PAS domain S-box-containing protein